MYIDPMATGTVNERLRAARIAAGFDSGAAAARFLGIGESTYYNHENGHAGIPPRAAMRYAKAFGISIDDLYGTTSRGEQPTPRLTIVKKLPIVGIVQAGIWREAAEQEPRGEIPVVPDSAWGGARQYAVEVEGDSMDALFEPGCFAVVVDWADLGKELKNGDIVVLERRRAGLCETSLKRARVLADRVEFVGESSNLKWRQPIVVTADEVDSEVAIKGLVVGKYIKF